MTGSKASESWRCPAVVTREIGRQRRSAARWILDVSPPRERPSDSRLGLARGLAVDFLSFDPAPCVQHERGNDLLVDIGRGLVAGTGGVLMGPDHSGVDPDRPLRTLGHVGVATELIEDPHPGLVT